MVGPEGGFSTIEIPIARDAGALTVSLGPRILRTETAGPILAALALYQAGDLEPVPPTSQPPADLPPPMLGANIGCADIPSSPADPHVRDGGQGSAS